LDVNETTDFPSFITLSISFCCNILAPLEHPKYVNKMPVAGIANKTFLSFILIPFIEALTTALKLRAPASQL
jgi:hypothetical protein